MPGQKISSMTLVSDLQDNDQFPVARNGSTYRISGASLASKNLLLKLSASLVTEFATQTFTEYLSSAITELTENYIPNPLTKFHSQVLTYNSLTETWVASAAPSSLPRENEATPYQILTFSPTTFSWVASAAPRNSSIDNTANVGDGAPIGSVMYFATSTVPVGWFECAGQEINKSAFRDLWNAIGYAFGSNRDGSAFRLPDLRSETIRGWDNGRGIDPNRVFGSFQKGSVAGDTSRIVLSAEIPLLSAKNILGFDSDTGNNYAGLTLPPLSSANYNIVVVDEEEPVNLPTLSAVVGLARVRNVALLPCIKYANYKGLTPIGLSAQSIIDVVNALSAYSLGTNQEWYELSASRLSNVTYTNSTLKPIFVQVYYFTDTAPLVGTCSAIISLNGNKQTTIYGTYGTGNFSSNNINFIVPPFWEYKVMMHRNGVTSWVELR